MAAKPKLKIMVASTVYNFEDHLNQICAILIGFGYEVWNSHIGTIPTGKRDVKLRPIQVCAKRPFLGKTAGLSYSVTEMTAAGFDSGIGTLRPAARMLRLGITTRG